MSTKKKRTRAFATQLRWSRLLAEDPTQWRRVIGMPWPWPWPWWVRVVIAIREGRQP